MSLAFQRALIITLGFEGGYSDDPVDKGGPTKWGITQTTYDGWRLSHGHTLRPVADMEKPECEAIYESDYWIPAHCHELPLNLACVHFDAFVNHRPGAAFRFLQLSALCRYVDGKWGPETQQRVAQAFTVRGEPTMIADYLAARAQFYMTLATHDPTQERFLDGWKDRVKRLAAMFNVNADGTRLA